MKFIRLLTCLCLGLGLSMAALGKTLMVIEFKNGLAGTEPEGWLDQRQGMEPAATIAYSRDGAKAVIQVTSDHGWGSIRYVPITLNPDRYHYLELSIRDMNQDIGTISDHNCHKPLTRWPPAFFSGNLQSISA